MVLKQTWAVNRCALLVPARLRERGAEDLRECTENLIVFKEGHTRKEGTNPYIAAKSKTYYLAITMNKVSQRPSERVPSIVDVRSASSNSLKQYRWPLVDSMVLH